jgi:hypothetical protein
MPIGRRQVFRIGMTYAVCLTVPRTRNARTRSGLGAGSAGSLARFDRGDSPGQTMLADEASRARSAWMVSAFLSVPHGPTRALGSAGTGGVRGCLRSLTSQTCG